MSASRPRAFVWGASGHAKVVADAAHGASELEVVGFIDERRPERRGETLLGLPILGGAEALEGLRASGVTRVLLGVGDNDARVRILLRARELGFTAPPVIHPCSVVARDVVVGEGTVVLAGAIVNPGAKIGAAVILNTACSVDHDCELGDGVHLSPGARLAGAVRVGPLSWIGIGSSVIQCVSVGARTWVGAGSVVVRNLPDDCVAYGSPARPQRARH